jgi:hypothetical protein
LGILGLASLQELATHSAASLSHSKVAMALHKQNNLPLPTTKNIPLQKKYYVLKATNLLFVLQLQKCQSSGFKLLKLLQDSGFPLQ